MIELHREIRGSGPTLVILHGLFGSLANWRSVAKALADRFTVCSVDLRNHGRSPHDPVHTYSAMTCDLAGLLEDLGVGRAHVMGHSMGGKVAMNFALTYPHLVDHLIVVDVAPARYEGGAGMREVLDAMLRIEAETIASRDAADAILRTELGDSALCDFLLMNLRRNSDGAGFRWRVNLRAIDENWASLGAAVTSTTPWRGPTLFVRGGCSAYLPAESKGKIRALFPAAEIASIDNAGHWVHSEQPLAFVQVISRFLQKRPA
jgi:esterase